MRIAVILMAALTLGDCAARRTAALPDPTAAAQDDAICRDMGLLPSNPAYAECRLIQQARRDAASAKGGR